jgi:ABC-type transport system involved in cytochrome c biogenesis permease subunit
MVLALAPFPFYLLGLWKRSFLYPGLAFHSAYIVSRGLELGRLPLVGPHDTLFFVSASVVTFSIPFSISLGNDLGFRRAIVLAAVAFAFFGIISRPHNTPLPPVLKTFWFELHVVLAFLSYGLFAIGAVLAARSLTGRDDELEGLQYRAIFVGYWLFSLSMIFGGVWAYLAWGTYWLWTPKELWTSIVWLYYSLYLHARLVRGWTGKPLAVLGIAGFLVVMFTYLGVSLLLKSSHTF